MPRHQNTFKEIEQFADPKAKIRAYQSYLEDMPRHALGWYNLAITFEEVRRYGDARRAMRRALQLSPTLDSELPERWRELVGKHAGSERKITALERAEAYLDKVVAGYRITRVSTVCDSYVLYDAERDDGQVTLRMLCNLPVEVGKRVLEQEAGLSHRPNGLLDVVSVVEAEDGTPMQVLPRLRATVLSQLASGGVLDYDVIAHLMRAIALVLHELHELGVIHGDLHSEHALRDDTSIEHHVYLLGAINKLRSADSPAPMGRLLWTTPEEGRPAAIGPTTDVYGLGLMMYHLLTGQEPPSLAERLQTRVPPMVSGTSWAGLNDIVWRCLENAPDARYQSAQEVADALQEMLAATRDDVESGPLEIGSWRLDKVIHERSFATVYEGRSTSAVSRSAEVRLLHPHIARNPVQRQRFLDEAIAASRIDHPNIISIYDGDILDGETCYVATERLDGAPLDNILLDGAMPIWRTARLGRQVASALAAAHHSNIVHRDLKPRSILLLPLRSRQDFVKLLDFGTATLHGALTERGFSVTGRLVGAPQYMAPEQWDRADEVSGAADIYALGLILYECLAGRHPFAGVDAIAEWRRVHAAASVPSLGPEVPSELTQLIQRMLSKTPSERPSAEEVEDALEPYISRWHRALDWRTGARARTLFFTLSFVVAVLVWWFAGYQQQRSTTALSPARLTLYAGGWILATIGLMLVLRRGLFASAVTRKLVVIVLGMVGIACAHRALHLIEAPVVATIISGEFLLAAAAGYVIAVTVARWFWVCVLLYLIGALLARLLPDDAGLILAIGMLATLSFALHKAR